MAVGEDILISVDDRYARSMLAGSKTVELRRRILRIAPGTRVWVYAKVPRAHIELVAIASSVEVGPPIRLWQRYEAQIAVSHCEFADYFAGVAVGCAIVFSDIFPLQPSIKLSELRGISGTFHPPQFFKRLDKNTRELEFFAAAWLSRVPFICA